MGSLRSLIHNPLPRKKKPRPPEQRWHHESKRRIKRALKSRFETLTFKVSVKTDPNYEWKPENSIYWQKALRRSVRVEWDISGLVLQEQIYECCEEAVKKVCKELNYNGDLFTSLGEYYFDMSEVLP
jgi:hypothetical protein